ncbi:hypothetical protein [Kibdelosporangium philippinense]|uniref:hypothetical protein n=1 Tax=Kibdelosporangium philippinense TaxID=211113 RepID=UPI0036080B38
MTCSTCGRMFQDLDVSWMVDPLVCPPSQPVPACGDVGPACAGDIRHRKRFSASRRGVGPVTARIMSCGTCHKVTGAAQSAA